MDAEKQDSSTTGRVDNSSRFNAPNYNNSVKSVALITAAAGQEENAEASVDLSFDHGCSCSSSFDIHSRLVDTEENELYSKFDALKPEKSLMQCNRSMTLWVLNTTTLQSKRQILTRRH